MSKTIVIVGFGPGVSTAVAERFGAEGFAVGLIGRSQARLAAGVEALKSKSIKAVALPADASDPVSLRSAISRAGSELGPIGILHWNVYDGHGVGDLMTVDPAGLHAAFDLPVVGLLSAVQHALPDLKSDKDGAVLITNGAYGEINPVLDGYALAAHAEAVALGNAAKAKLVGLLAARLKDEGVFVGEVTIGGTIGAAGSGIEPGMIAEAFWRLYQARDANRARVS
jgi:NADP-dependent 3-hydroxy acid dehydrogenase YdfG